MFSRWLRLLTPHWRASSVAEISAERLKKYAVVVVDVDNTVVMSETTDVPQKIGAWLRSVRATHRVVCVSNSLRIRRRQRALEQLLGCRVLAGGGKKPFRRVWETIARHSQAVPETTVVIGDRLFTDVLFGNRIGAATILVEPLSNREAWWIRQIRRVERALLRRIDTLNARAEKPA